MDLRSQQRVYAQPRVENVAPAGTTPATGFENIVQRDDKKRPLKKPIVYGVAAVLALSVLGLAVKGATSLADGGVLGVSTSGPSVSQDKYQALFLTNGQVYFGKVISMNSETVTLRDIYYLQQNVQSGTDAKNTAQQSQLQLTKLGGELHGPEDVMYIERSQVLFWENLKNDSQVVKKIQEAKSQKQ